MENKGIFTSIPENFIFPYKQSVEMWTDQNLPISSNFQYLSEIYDIVRLEDTLFK